MKRLTCAAIVPTYNRAHFIAESIDSLLNQTRKPDRIIVVNDGSSDDTLDVLQRYAGDIEIVSKPNGGKSSAINAAMSRVREDCVWVFDDDDVALPDALERHLEALESDTEAGFTYSPVLVGRSGDDGRIVVVHDTLFPKIERSEFLVRLMEHCFIHGQPAIVARTEHIREIGLFDERLVRSQDYDIFLRLARRWPAARIDQPTFIQRRHDGRRGNMAESCGTVDPFEAWSRYNRIFIKELLESLPLASYIGAIPIFRPRTACIQRFVIAARHGILDHAERDLACIVESQDDLTADERRLLVGTLTHFTALREIGADTCRRLAGLCRGRVGRQVRVSMAKGLFYEILAAVPERRAAMFRSLMPRIIGLIGLSGTFELVREKFGSVRTRMMPEA